MKNLTIILIVILNLFAFDVCAKKDPDTSEEIEQIKNLFDQIKSSSNDKAKIAINNQLISYLLDFLEESKSFDANYDSLKYLSVLKSDDKLLNVITWNLLFKDNSFKYFGFLQYKNKDKISVYFLDDKKYKPIENEDQENIELHYTTNTEWFGALYYELITKKYNNNTYYTLIGWDGADLTINRKVVEVLKFNRNGLPVFGNKAFKSKKNTKDRLIFEYGERISMLLRYNSKHDIIVMDYLVPTEERYTGMSQFYGPSRSYDALMFRNGKWYLESNIDPDIAINYKRDPNIEKIQKRGVSKNF